jgi:DNA polymerase-3 subunit gamma/tau
MAYVALYRQWRPQDFEQLVGQEHISTTLKNAIAAKRIAHAYLFSGPRGTGKTSTAKILAKALNCVQGPTIQPCNTCNSCLRITDGSSMDVLEIDAASNRGIDEIRELREKVKFTPVDGKFKVYIIDEVHMLTTEAFNALLKTLEEPPAHAIFILATTEPHKIPATILSRCQRYDFRRIESEDIVGRLRKVAESLQVQADEEALELIARAAEGGMRDALSILDQCIAFGGEVIRSEQVRSMLGLAGEEWLLRMSEALLHGNISEALAQIQNLVMLGKDPRQVLLELIIRLRNQLVHQSSGNGSKSPGPDDPNVSADEYMEMIQILSDAAQEAKWAPQPRIVLEMAVIKICRRQKAADISSLLARIEKLEGLLAGRQIIETFPSAIKPNPPVQHTQPTQQPPQQSGGNVPVLDLAAPTEGVRQQNTSKKAEVPQNLGELWDRILAELLKNNKRAIHTCLSEGKLVTVTPEHIVFGFQLSIYKERIEKDDYRSFLEKLVAQITGCNRGVKCCIMNEAETEQMSPGSNVVQENPLVKNAVAMFGEQVVTIVHK